MSIADAIATNRATCLFCDEFPKLQRELQVWAETSDRGRLVSIEFERLPEISNLNDELLSHLAQAALLLWPDWYSGRHRLDQPAEFGMYADRVCRDRPEVNRKWLTAAWKRCHQCRSPLLQEFSATVQLRQLRLALAGQQLAIAIFITATNPPTERLLGLARSLEWLSRETEASVLAIMPTVYSTRSELDAINSTAVILQPEAPEPAPPSTLIDDANSASNGSSEERKHLVCPIVGRPHPGSPGEQQLANQLATDDELASLFQFNQRVITSLDSRFIVDLLWSEGRIVVEIDGYGYHSSRSMFNSDRQRDYELTISNYLVLRLPHDFVVQDPELACERIREFVQFRRQHPVHQEMTA